MLGPVIRMRDYRPCEQQANSPVSKAILPTSPPSLTSLGIKSFLVARAGCRRSLKSIHAALPSINSGLQTGSPRALEDFAKLNRQSNSANTRMARNQMPRSVSNSANRRNLKSLMAVDRFSRASFNLRTVGCSDGTIQRIAA